MRNLAATLTEKPQRSYDGPPVRARGYRVLVQPHDDAFETPAGLLIDSHNIMLAPTQYATVLSVGEKVALDIKPGDVVCYKRRCGYELADKYCGQLFLNEDMIDGVKE